MSPTEERARVYAVKAWRLARSGQFERARDSFVQAVRLDPGLDLTRVPNFWDLPRGAHEAAADALNLVDRKRDASRLLAIVDRKFRPRLVSPRTVRMDD